jgi:hypothetical protein
MITRRDALKTSIASALVPATAPATAATAGPAPTVPAATRPDADGAIRVRLPVGYESESARKQYYIAVQIMPLDTWRALGLPVNGELTDDTAGNDEDWSGVLLEDGRVVGVRLEGEDAFDREDFPRAIPDPDAAKALRRIRRQFMDVLEVDPEIGSASVHLYGNGECVVNVTSELDRELEITFMSKG